jgi:hypothetical protein
MILKYQPFSIRLLMETICSHWKRLSQNGFGWTSALLDISDIVINEPKVVWRASSTTPTDVITKETRVTRLMNRLNRCRRLTSIIGNIGSFEEVIIAITTSNRYNDIQSLTLRGRNGPHLVTLEALESLPHLQSLTIHAASCADYLLTYVHSHASLTSIDYCGETYTQYDSHKRDVLMLYGALPSLTTLKLRDGTYLYHCYPHRLIMSCHCHE